VVKKLHGKAPVKGGKGRKELQEGGKGGLTFGAFDHGKEHKRWEGIQHDYKIDSPNISTEGGVVGGGKE